MDNSNQTADNKFLGTEKVGKLLKMFSIPCVLSLIIQALYNLVDQIFIGNSTLGQLGNTATGIVYPLTVIALALGLFIGDGAAACISINQGRNQTKDTHKTIGTGIVIGLMVSLVLVAVSFIFRNQILMGFGAQEESVLACSIEYSTWIIIGFPLFLLACVLNPIIRADGSPKFAMLSMALGAVTNIILDPIFIYALNMGMNGAAFATFIGQLVTFVLSVAYFFRSKNFKLTLKSFIPNFKLLWQCLKLGISSFLTQISIVIISVVTNNILNLYLPGDTAAIGLLTIAFKVFGIVVSIAVGIAAGGQPVLGYNYGAKRYSRVKEALGYILLSTFIVGAVATLLFEVCPQYILAIFGYSQVPEFGMLIFRIYLGFILLTCLTKVVSIIFQAIGSPVKSTLIAMLRDLIFLVPLTILLPLSTKTIYPFYWAAPISDTLTAIIAALLLLKLLKQINSEQVPAPESEVSIVPSKEGVIVIISRQHGAGGREIGQKLAQKMGVPFYDKELTSLTAQESGLAQEYISNIEEKDSILYDLYLSTEANQAAIKAQEKVLMEIAKQGSCVIVGRAADYVLKDFNPFRVFVFAPATFKQNRIMQNYGDDENLAQQNMEKADKRRAKFYNNVTGQTWGNAQNYNLSVDSSIGIDKVVEQIYQLTSQKNGHGQK